jgi:hypothetical protein
MMAIARTGCCTSLLYGAASGRRNNVKRHLTGPVPELSFERFRPLPLPDAGPPDLRLGGVLLAYSRPALR